MLFGAIKREWCENKVIRFMKKGFFVGKSAKILFIFE